MKINPSELEHALSLIKWRLDELKYAPESSYDAERNGLSKTYDLLVDISIGNISTDPLPKIKDTDPLKEVLLDIQKTNVELGKQLRLSEPLF